MGSYLGTFMFIDRLFEGFRGYELVDRAHEVHARYRPQPDQEDRIRPVQRPVVSAAARDTDRIVPMDEVLPPLFMTGLQGARFPFPLQTLPEFIICDVDQHIEPYYIDVAESFGLAC